MGCSKAVEMLVSGVLRRRKGNYIVDNAGVVVVVGSREGDAVGEGDGAGSEDLNLYAGHV